MQKARRMSHSMSPTQPWSRARRNTPLPGRAAGNVVSLEAVTAKRPAESSLWTQAADFEMQCVRRCAALMRYRWLRALTIGVNLLGNGWIYLPLALALAWLLPHGGHVIAAATLSAALAHLLYAPLKRRIARHRPFEQDRRLAPLTRALDRYAFPSGHCMTLTAVLVPVMHAAPAAWPFALAALAALAWCRLAAAHHYPTDVAAGIVIGFVIATPCTLWTLGR